MTRVRTRSELARRDGEDWQVHRRRVREALLLEHVGLEAYVGEDQARDAVEWQRFGVGSLAVDVATGAYLGDAAAARLVEGDALPPREGGREVPARGPLLAAVRGALSVVVPGLVADALDRLPSGWSTAQRREVRDALEAAMYPPVTRHRRDRSGDGPAAAG